MNRRYRTRFVGLVLGLISALPLSSAQAQSVAPAADLGLLVGLSSERTLWISSVDGQSRVVADRPYLLVPRNDGFWWVGTVNRCVAEELNGEGMNITEEGAFVFSQQEIFVRRVRDTARVALDGEDCASAEEKTRKLNVARWRARADSLAAAGDSTALQSLPADSATLANDSEGLYCEIGTRTITFVSPHVISVENRHRVTEFCSPAKYYESGENRVMRFEDTTYIDMRRVLTQRQRQRLSRDLADWLNGGNIDDSGDANGIGWALERDSGGWVASVFVDGPMVARGGSDMQYRPAVTRNFTGAAALPISWAKLKKLVPNLRDAMASPSGSHVALLAGDTLIVAPVRAGTLGEPLTKVGVGPYQDFVMLRWVSGAQVAQWNREIPSLPAPFIKVQQP